VLPSEREGTITEIVTTWLINCFAAVPVFEGADVREWNVNILPKAYRPPVSQPLSFSRHDLSTRCISRQVGCNKVKTK